MNAFLLSAGVFIRESVGVIVVLLLMQRFGSINGWNSSELLFLFSILFLTYSVLVMFFAGVRDFSGLVQNGALDSLYIRPLGILFQVVASKSDYFASIGHGLVGVVLIAFTAGKAGIEWNIEKIIYLSIMLASGVFIQLSVWLLAASLSIWAVNTENVVNFLFWNVRKFAGYPVSIFPPFIQKILIYILPFAFVNYFPSQFFFRKPDMSQYPAYFLYLSPLVAVVMFSLVFLLWKFSLKQYTSTGTAQ
jgi:ABC-2 type transport system permease protein